MIKLTYGNIELPASENKGIIKPDSAGWYRITGGVFNTPNRLGITYRANQYILECLEVVGVAGGSDLRRRLDRGEVYMEMDHPVQWFYEKIDGKIVRTKITDVFTWVARLKKIDMDRVCAHIKNIVPDTSKFNLRTRTGPIKFDIITMPFGPFGDYFKTNLDTPEMGTAVSIRTVTAPQEFGDTTREVEHWTGLDWVPEPGFTEATKYRTSLNSVSGNESFLDTYNMTPEEKGFVISAKESIQFLEHALGDKNAIETVGGMESYDQIKGMLSDLKRHYSREGDRLIHVVSDASPIDLF